MFTSIFDLSQKSTLPYSDTPYRKSYTGVAAFDVYLGNFMCFFMTIAERKSDDLYLFWVWMAGQFGPLFGIMMLETVRDGHKSKHPYM